MIKGSADLFAEDAYTSQFYFAPEGGVEACLANVTGSLYPGCFNSSYTYATEEGGWNVGYAADPNSPWLHFAADWVGLRFYFDLFVDASVPANSPASPAPNLPALHPRHVETERYRAYGVRLRRSLRVTARD